MELEQLDTGDAHLALSLIRGLGPTLTARALAHFHTPQRLLAATPGELRQVHGLGPKTIDQFLTQRRTLTDTDLLERHRDMMLRHGVRLIPLDDPAYPPLLKLIPDAPASLYVRGELHAQDNVSLAIVGSRRCSVYGRDQAARLAQQAADCGMMVVSGGAYGIDAAAHRAVVVTHQRTTAVIGSGLARPYPSDHAELFDQIVAEGGAVVSELPMDTPPAADNFPARNRIISGLSLGVLVIEAAERSGALITARLATEEHGREVMALPGRADSPGSAGCHDLIRKGGATLVTTLAHILEALGETGRQLTRTPRAQSDASTLFAEPPLAATPGQQAILNALDTPRTVDTLVTMTGLPVHTLLSELTLLELKGQVVQGWGGSISRKRSV